VIERDSQATVIIVFESNEAEWLQHAVLHILHGAKGFGHSVDWASLGLKRHFDEVALGQRTCQTQQASSDRNGLKVCLGTAAIFETNRSQNGVAKLDPGRAPRGVRLGEVSHRSHRNYDVRWAWETDYGGPSSEFLTSDARKQVRKPCNPSTYLVFTD